MTDRIDRVFQSMVEYCGENRRQITHAALVYTFAEMIARGENLDPGAYMALRCAAILHDIGVGESLRAFDTSADGFHEFMGQRLAAEILAGLGFSGALTERITFLIGHHHSDTAESGTALQILVEAEVLADLSDGVFGDTPPREVADRRLRSRTGREYAASMFAIPPSAPIRPQD